MNLKNLVSLILPLLSIYLKSYLLTAAPVDHGNLDESKIPYVGIGDGQSSVNNIIKLNNNVSNVEVYGILEDDKIIFTFNVADFDECDYKSTCNFTVDFGEDVAEYTIEKIDTIIQLGIKINNENRQPFILNFTESLTTITNKNGKVTVENKGKVDSALKELKTIPTKDNQQAVRIKFDGSELKNASVKLYFPPPPVCYVDYKIVDGIINTGVTNISKEIHTTTGVTSTSSNKNNDKTNIKEFREKYSKKLTGVKANAGISLKGILDIGVSGSHSSENGGKDRSETSYLQDVTTFVESSLHKTTSVKVTYVFPPKTSTIIKQLFVKCGHYAVDTGVLMIDQYDLSDGNGTSIVNNTDLKSAQNSIKFIDNDANVADILVLLFLMYFI